MGGDFFKSKETHKLKLLKIFLTGDNHIGLKFLNHIQHQFLSEIRVKIFKDMVEVANNKNCDLFVIAGDLFDRTDKIPEKYLNMLAERLGEFHGIILIIPGNHDYYNENVPIWRDFRRTCMIKGNILFLSDYRPYEIPMNDADKKVIVYPAGCHENFSSENNLKWIKELNIIPDEAFKIGIAHGAVEGFSIDVEGRYFLMREDELNNIPVDVWLMGHTHIPFRLGKIFNAGTHVQTDVNNEAGGNYLIIEIEDGSGIKNIKATRSATDSPRFYKFEINLTPGNFRDELFNFVKNIRSSSIIELIFNGSLTDEEYKLKDAIIREGLNKFLEYSYNFDGVHRIITSEIIKTEFPEVGFNAKFLNALLNDPYEAQMAYDLLKALENK